MTKPGIDADGVAEKEADNFMKCPACSQWFDMRDLAQVVEHIHDSEIEEGACGSLMGLRGAEPAGVNRRDYNLSPS
jgi:hypothetical protein